MRPRVVAMAEEVYRVFQPAIPRVAFQGLALRAVADYQDMDRPAAVGQLMASCGSSQRMARSQSLA